MHANVGRASRRKLALVILFALGAFALAACGSPSSTGVVPLGTTASTTASSTPSTTTTASASSQPPVTTGTPGGSATTPSPPSGNSRVITPPVIVRKPVPPPPKAPAVSAASLAYAKKLGGKSHKGETLYFVVGDSVSTEAEARAALQKALPKFDTALYMIVQHSDNFEGMRPGWWVVIEAYRDASHARAGATWDKRGFADCYVRQAKVLTSAPIPVVEDVTTGL
jgi:hypothetical protein